MPVCARCTIYKEPDDFYRADRTCKECRKALVRTNRAKNVDYYREYDRQRANDNDRVEARKKYQSTERGKAASSAAKSRYIERNPIKRAAHIAVGNALRDGILVRGCCEVCGTDAEIHGHHDDYAFPLVVRWLCARHHADWHNDNEPMFGGKPLEDAA